MTRTPEPDGYVHTAAQEIGQRPNWLAPSLVEATGGAVHLVVFHPGTRRPQGRHRWRLWGGTLPSHSFVAAGEGSFVSSPEFCFLQMALELPLVELVALGMELCGHYCLDPDEDRGFAMRTEPLTSRDRIGRFLDQAVGARGRKGAARALQYVIDGSASPMETAIAMLLTLPYKHGGYHIPRPCLNYQIELTGEALQLAGGRRCFGDICWPEHRLDLEYLGRFDHDGEMSMLSDRRRTLAIEETGYEVIEITKEQVLDMRAFEIVTLRIADKLGHRVNKGKCGPTPQRKKLGHAIMNWNSTSGRGQAAQHSEPPDDDEGTVYGRMS